MTKSLDGLYAESALVHDPWNIDGKSALIFGYDINGATDVFIMELVKNLPLYQLDTNKLFYREIAQRMFKNMGMTGLGISIHHLYSMKLCRSSMTQGEIGYSNLMLNLARSLDMTEDEKEFCLDKDNLNSMPPPSVFKKLFTMNVLEVLESYAEKIGNQEVKDYIKSYKDQTKKDVPIDKITFRAIVECGEKTNETYTQEFVKPFEQHIHKDSDYEKVLTLCTNMMTNIVKYKNLKSTPGLARSNLQSLGLEKRYPDEFIQFSKAINATVKRSASMGLVETDPIDDVIFCAVAAFGKMLLKRLHKLVSEYAAIVSCHNNTNEFNFKKKYIESKLDYFCNLYIGIFNGSSSKIGKLGSKLWTHIEVDDHPNINNVNEF